MSKQTINIGASPNDGTGTPLRTSFDYTNQNFTELYTALGGGVGLPGATTQVIFNDGGTNLAGDAGLVYNKTTDALTVAGLVTAGSATITGALTVDTTTLVVDATNDRVGIGTASPAVSLDIRGASAAATLEVLRLQNTGGGANTKTRLNFYAASTNYASITGGFGASTPELIFDINTSTGEFIWNNLGSEAMRLNSTANLVLKGGTVGANGVGVTFPATQVASSDANCLDDYEEGTFLPTIVGTSDPGSGVPYIGQNGKYTKVGNLVTFQVFLDWNVHTGTGNMRIGNLPFTNGSNFWAGSLGYLNGIALTAGNIMTGYVEAGQSYVTLQQTPTGGGTSGGVPIDTSGTLIFSGSYTIA